MIEWVKSHQRNATICGLTLLVPMILYLYMFFGAWGLRAEYASDMSRLPQRIARLHGLQEVEEQLRESSAAVAAVNLETCLSIDCRKSVCRGVHAVGRSPADG